MYNKAVQQMSKALGIFSYLLMVKGYFKCPLFSLENLNNRYNTRMKMYENLHFVQRYSFGEFTDSFNYFTTDETCTEKLKIMLDNCKTLLSKLISVNF